MNTISVVPATELEQQEKDLYEVFQAKQRETDEAKTAWAKVYHQLREQQQAEAFKNAVLAEIARLGLTINPNPPNP